jgi:hypothetical protein
MICQLIARPLPLHLGTTVRPVQMAGEGSQDSDDRAVELRSTRGWEKRTAGGPLMTTPDGLIVRHSGAGDKRWFFGALY